MELRAALSSKGVRSTRSSGIQIWTLSMAPTVEWDMVSRRMRQEKKQASETRYW